MRNQALGQSPMALFGRALDQAERMLIAVTVDFEGGDQHRFVANMQASTG
mgnify:CR=1 FL=1